MGAPLILSMNVRELIDYDLETYSNAEAIAINQVGRAAFILTLHTRVHIEHTHTLRRLLQALTWSVWGVRIVWLSQECASRATT